jgi:periplasmic protein TonB
MKKNKQSDLEHRRAAFLVIGLMVSLATTLVAFEWTSFSYERAVFNSSADYTLTIDEEIIAHHIEQPKPPAKTPSFIPEIIKIVKEPTDPGEDKKPLVFTIDNKFTFGDGDDDFGTAPSEGGDPILVNWASLQHKPHFAHCENVLDPDAQALCTESEVISFVVNNIKVPQDLKGTKGRVYVFFTIDEKGEVTDIEIMQGIHKRLDAAVVRTVEQIPQMVPGSQMGKPVKVRFKLPVTFK